MSAFNIRNSLSRYGNFNYTEYKRSRHENRTLNSNSNSRFNYTHYKQGRIGTSSSVAYTSTISNMPLSWTKKSLPFMHEGSEHKEAAPELFNEINEAKSLNEEQNVYHTKFGNGKNRIVEKTNIAMGTLNKSSDKRAHGFKRLSMASFNETIHRQINKSTKDDVTADALHTYERIIEKPVLFLSRKASNKIADKINAEYKYLVNGSKIQSIPNKQQNFGVMHRAAWAARHRAKLFKERITSMAAKNGGKTVVGFLGNVAKHLATKNAGFLVALFILLVVIILYGMFATSVITVLTSFIADESEITSVTEYLKQLDSEFISMVDDIPDNYTDIDEVDLIYNGAVGTNPIHALSYLTVKYGDFLFSDVKSEIENIHDALYSVSEYVEVEIRTRTVEKEVEREGDDGTITTTIEEVEEEYEYKILHISVNCTPINDYVQSLMDADEREWYELLVSTCGNMYVGGVLGNPFIGVDWRPYITSPYGTRYIDGAYEFHPAIDIAWGGISGTPINAVHDGIVVQASNHSIYGNFVMLENNEMGVRTRYSHCSSISVSIGDTVMQGEIVGFVGSTGRSTGPHLDIEVYRNGSTVDPMTELSFGN